MSQEQNTSINDKRVFNNAWEQLIYKECEEKGYFEPDCHQIYNPHYKNPKPFCIMMPPPNVTGVLHIGHALTFTLQDIITRYKRMDGFRVLWQPGLDHAGIATQNVVEKRLLAEGIKKEDIGREAFIQKVWEWKEESGGKILEQMRIMGFSPAFKRTRFTMDKGLENAVKESFCSWYEKGFIYRGERMINWCTHDGALSDIEVEYEENKGKLYYLRYYLSEYMDSNGHIIEDIVKNEESKKEQPYIIVATTRPETFFGDTALMVHPEDSRYKHLIGKTLTLPLVGRKIQIIADSIVDMEFGSGAVKVTPAHDMNDYEVSLRHNLEHIVVFDKNGILNEYCGEFRGMERLKAREHIVSALEEAGFVEKIEDYTNKIGVCYRCGNIIEPYISKQWFVRKEAAQGAIERVNNAETRFYPSQWKNNYDAWMRDLRDWCISRQLWWGHRIPVFYCECGNEFASKNENPVCHKCGSKNITQDNDVLDTWFSSGLWTHSTLGFGNGDFGKGELWQENDLNDFHPNSLLITGFDILFFWVARMLLSADINCKEIAFKDIYLHALVLDEKGQKMSKSKGNVIDPLNLCATYSPDVVRFSLAFLCVQGRDIRLSQKQLEITRNFTNKIINAMSFLELYAGQLEAQYVFSEKENLQEYKTPLGIYMKSRLNLAIAEVRNALEAYRFDLYASVLYRFLWNEFCDIGIECAKANKESVFELASILIESMKLLHPLMPFLSEYIFQRLLGRDIEAGLKENRSIMIESFPRDTARNITLEKGFEITLDSITTIRRMRANLGISSDVLSKVFIELQKDDQELLQSLYIGQDSVSFDRLFVSFVAKLAKVQEVVFVDSKPSQCIADIGEITKVYLAASNFDVAGILERLDKQEQKIQKEITKLEGMLNNKNFIANAPESVVLQNKQNLHDLQEKLTKVLDEKKALQV
ncbi:valine--tRNA ligase [Helicobacter trogontum]|uniref:Valine--tRNA ligase n=1 Tax=Helicobacter trogontum TaxID=50960 RepID=A0A4V6I375_9HELI|nr:valine--tRNA ligase [Helicobacter trogontum]MDY5185295.1 valine--tRNA ligase [Helicobacter trogontum]TLD98962.1 valine--tRNA ligase [Helicobacter trogontum]